MVCAYPNSCTLSALADHIVNKRVGDIIFFCIYTSIFFIMTSYLLVIGKTMQGIFWSDDICIATATFYSCLVLLFFNQVRSLHEVSFLSFISMVTILVVLVFCLKRMIDKDTSSDVKTDMFPEDIDFFEAFGAY
eukprot:UN04776